MELRHLRYFVRVAEERHFGRAANALGISQPPLSQQVRALEMELGVDLFERTSRRVELTEAGRLFLPEARAVLDQAAHAIDVARRFQLGEVGELSIAFVSSVPFVPIVAQALARFRSDHPAIHQSLFELSLPAQIVRIADRRVDLGFIRSFTLPTVPAAVVVVQLIEESLVVAIRDDHPLAREDRPLTFADLAGQPLVTYDQAMGGGFNEEMGRLFQRRNLHYHVIQEVGGLASLLGLVSAGVGMSIMSNSLAVLQTQNLAYRPITDPEATSRLWLLHRRQPSIAARRFIGMLDEALEPEAG